MHSFRKIIIYTLYLYYKYTVIKKKSKNEKGTGNFLPGIFS